MTVYVDDLRAYDQAPKPGAERHFGNGKLSCHLATDGPVAELITFGERISLRRQWLQFSSAIHFDLTPSKREAAVRAGAVEVSTERLLLICGSASTIAPYPSDPMSYELRHQALVALLNYASIESREAASGVLNAIEGLQAAIGCPLTGEEAIQLWTDLRNADVEPTWETWCAHAAVPGETARDAARRLSLQDAVRLDGWVIRRVAVQEPLL